MRVAVQYIRIFPITLIFLILFCETIRAQSPKPEEKNSSLGSLHFGLVYKRSHGGLTIDSLFFFQPPISKEPVTQPYQILVYGFTGVLENSFILGYFAPQSSKRFRWGDHFLGQFSAGLQFSNIPGSESKFWGAYRFEIGGIGQFQASQNMKWLINWNLLVYEKDVISPYISGSSLGLEIQRFPIFLGASLLARDSRIIGFIPALIHPHTNPHDFEFKLGYRLANKNDIGVKLRFFNASTATSVEEYPTQNLQKNFSLQILYGHSF